MKNSIFNIVQDYKDGYLLYNTFTTSLVELTKNLYTSIFIKGDYSFDEVVALYDMGFLVDNDCDEIREMETLRSTVILNSSHKISNIIIAPTLECNAHCFYCFENGYRKGKMTIETADVLVNFLVNNWDGEKLGITWFGGEPLLSEEIIDYVSRKLTENHIIFGCKLTTNGTLFTEAVAKKAKSLWNVEKVQITIDAIGEEYNRIKNYDKEFLDAFSVVVKNIHTAISLGINIKIRINFDPLKQDKALATLTYLISQFNNSDLIKIYFAPIDADDEIVKNITHGFEELNEHPYISLIKFGRKHRLYRGFPDMENDEPYDNVMDPRNLLKKLKIHPSPTNCYASCPNVLTIGPNGEIYKCHRVLGRTEYVSGNICNGIEKNEAYNFFCNTNLTYEECKTCALLPICQGGCKVNAQLYSGKEACAPSKAIIKDLLLLYKEDLDQII